MNWFFRWIKDRVDWESFCYTLHFFVSAVLVILGVHFGLTRLQAVGASVFIGLLKEVYDVMIRNKTGDFMDIACDLCGAFVGWLFVQ